MLGFVLIIGFCLRIYKLGTHSFWYDEAMTLFVVFNLNLQTLAKYCIHMTWPPLFHFLLKFWIVLGESEFLLRLFLVLFSLFSIVLIYSIGKRLFDQKVGLISACLLTLSPFHIYYSQELNNYGFFVFLVLLSVYCFIMVLNKNNFLSWSAYVSSIILCLYCRNIALSLWLFQNIYFFLFCARDEKKRIKWLISQLIILIFYIPWFYVLNYQLLHMYVTKIFFWVPQPNVEMVIHTFNVFNLGYNADKTAYFLSACIFFPLLVRGIMKTKVNLPKLFFLLLWLFLPIILVVSISKIFNCSIYLYKILIFISPAYYILLAKGLSEIKKKSVVFAISAIVLLLVAKSMWNYYSDIYPLPVIPYRPAIFIKKNYRETANYVKENYKLGDIVCHTSRSSHLPFLYYQKYNLENKWVTVSNSIDYLHWEEPIAELPSGYIKEILSPVNVQRLIKNYKRIWLVFSGWEFQAKEGEEIKRWLEERCRLKDKVIFGGIEIYLYDAKICWNR